MPATTPEQIHRMFETAFNDNDLDGLMALYEPDAVLVPQPGIPSPSAPPPPRWRGARRTAPGAT